MQTGFIKLRIAALLSLALLLPGCDPGREPAGSATPESTAEPVPAPQPGAPAPAEIDLTADKPEAAKAAPPPRVLLEEFTAQGPQGHRAARCYTLLAEMKSGAEQISKDLDGGGKESTRLLHTTDEIGKKINALVELWSEDASFRDVCSTAKRTTMVLNEELSGVPRKWTHVRWSFNQMIDDLGRLRLRAKELADNEPVPVPKLDKSGKPVVDKDGTPIYVEPEPAPLDAAIQRREEKKRELQEARDRVKQSQENRKDKPMPVDLDGN